ncbi:Gfo/Idh/MocA family protein [Undibacter mobilis]|uniref:Gfo/Idh/MocA family oxidoreductase n=1 Tax=Undibacter mobilis TaxID=2292256 RepID=A0A371B7R0_9BRAD|nr:Gfo/Idh/MocA family oxidoreductase [Undibacter mobilis]RDV03618.1 gfo/Idh/MocA family oxidoreductase [Undibacter mobilis]
MIRQHPIRLGIVGVNYGRTVLMPAFRADARCEVAAFAGSNEARAADHARAANVPKAYGDWRALIADTDIDAVAIATVPSLQTEIALAALSAGKPVFAEKPMASTLDEARAMFEAATASGLPTGIDFNFHQIMAWQRAKAMLDDGAIGKLRHVTVHWHVENYSIQNRMRNWKTLRDDGGGVLGNFISHCFHYLEWFAGPLAGLQARVGGLPGNNELDTTVAMALQYASGPLASLSMSCASFRGTGHRIEFYGEDGTLVLDNRTADYMRGFVLSHAKRPGDLTPVPVEDPADAGQSDGRVAPASRLAAKFIDAIAGKPRYKPNAAPDFAAGFRVQQLIDAAQRSNRDGRFVDVAPDEMK